LLLTARSVGKRTAPFEENETIKVVSGREGVWVASILMFMNTPNEISCDARVESVTLVADDVHESATR